MDSIGTHLEKAGWRQGSIVKHENIQRLLNIACMPHEAGLMLVVASQSCDIANNNLESEPCIELSIARKIHSPKGELTHNKNPRTLHTHLTSLQDSVISEDHIELRAFEKYPVPKESFLEISPDSDKVFEDKQLKSYVGWLSARYSRPALPTAFNNRVSKADPKGKLRKQANIGNEQLSGIYVEIFPDQEIEENEKYRVNLLGLLPARFTGDKSTAEATINAYAEMLKKAGMDVDYSLRTEDEVSIATINRFKRFYLDDLSFRGGTPLPPETTNNF